MPTRHPWSAVPARRSSEVRLRSKLYLLAAVAGLAVLSGPIGLAINLSHSKTPTVPAAPPALNRGTALAQIVADDFVAGVPTAVPVAAGVDPSLGMDTQQQSGQAPASLPVHAMAFEGYDSEYNAATGQAWQLNKFLLQIDTSFYVLDISTVDDHGLPVLGAEPALMPAQMAPTKMVKALSAANPALAYSQGGIGSLPGPVTAAVDTWANAFATGDSHALLTLANASSGQYPGLGGFTVDTTSPPQVVSATWTDQTDKTLLLRVAVVFDATSAKGYTVSGDYDLLVTQTTSETPKVVAWGPAGVAQLAAYGNNSNLP